MENVKDFGKTSVGEARLFTLKAGKYTASVTDFGATLVSFTIEGDDGRITDVLLGHNDASEYEKGHGHIGATIGRSANRIGGSKFTLNGKEYKLTPNENGNNLHSGPDLYDHRIFSTDGISADGRSVKFSLDSPDGDQGYPGNLKMSVTVSLSDNGSLKLHYEGTSDADTLFNPTNHSYFNLNGEGSGTILDHDMKIFADRFVCTDPESIPTGELRPVAGTPFDFCEAKKIGLEINADDEQIRNGTGYDHCFCLSDGRTELRKAVEVSSAESGLRMEVFTDLPGIQFYAGNFLKDEPGKSGHIYHKREGFALETEFYPDSINQPSFLQPVLKAGEKFESDTVYKLSFNK